MSWNNNIIHWQWFWVDNPTQNYPTYPNYANSDDIYLDDRTRPRDEYWFRLQPWRQMDKWDFKYTMKNYLPQISAVWGKEISWANVLQDTLIPVWLGTTELEWLPYSTYNTSLQAVLWWWKWWYTQWNLNWKLSNDWWIIIPQAWSYLLEFYSEVYLDPNIWQTTCMISLIKWLGALSRETKVTVSIPDYLSKVTILDFKPWDTVYIWWAHASASWKKWLYVWGITIFKL